MSVLELGNKTPNLFQRILKHSEGILKYSKGVLKWSTVVYSVPATLEFFRPCVADMAFGALKQIVHGTAVSADVKPRSGGRGIPICLSADLLGHLLLHVPNDVRLVKSRRTGQVF